MLKTVYIENIAVAKRLNVDFSPGFCVLTGETGAGKSILIDCLEALGGAKMGREMVRSGEERALISALFGDLDAQALADLKAAGAAPDENGELLIERMLTADGKTTVRVGGRTMPQAILKEIGPILLAVHAQEDNRSLLDRGEPIRILDAYAGLDGALGAYRTCYDELTAKEAEIAALRESLRDKAMMTDILTYQIAEIDAAKLTDPDEEEKLEKWRTKLKDIEQIAKHSSLVYRALAQNDKASAAYLIERAAQSVRQLSGVMEDAEELAARLDGYRYEIEDIAERVHDLVGDEDMAHPEEKLNQIEKRLSLIAKLERKYGPSVSDITEFRANAAKKLADLNAGDDRIAELESEATMLRARALAMAGKISESRVGAAERFAAEVLSTLTFLDMPKVRFVVDVSPRFGEDGQKKLGARGYDDVDFLLSANPGEPPASLSKIASGGEISRVMLAVKSVTSRQAGAATVVFDEIDAGVSGGTAEKIGVKLKELSAGAQVICVTHSPQIASLGDTHYKITKSVVDGRSESAVTVLDKEGRVAEISRIIGGVDITEKQLDAAREMIDLKTHVE